MSPISNRIEALAAQYKYDLLALFEMWMERAAIREFCAGLCRDEADRLALVDVEEWLNGCKR